MIVCCQFYLCVSCYTGFIIKQEYNIICNDMKQQAFMFLSNLLCGHSNSGNLKACYKTVDMSLSNREAEPTGQGRTLRHPNRPASLQSQHQQSYEVRDDPAPVVVATSPPSWPTGMDSTQVYSSGGSSLRKPSVPPVISELRSLAARNTPAQTVFASSSDPAIVSICMASLFICK